MFKENWPLTGLVKLLNPAAGRQLRLIPQAGTQSCELAASGSGSAGPAVTAQPRTPMWRAIWGRLANDSRLKEIRCGQTRDGAWMWKAEHRTERQTDL